VTPTAFSSTTEIDPFRGLAMVSKARSLMVQGDKAEKWEQDRLYPHVCPGCCRCRFKRTR
jgi:hypothetical protein